MVRIAACFITKGDDELEKLKQSVASVSPYVEGIYIVTNGAHEQTDLWCKESGLNTKHLPWNKDFSEQRNASFAMVPEGIEYIYWQDSDDVLVGGEHLQEVAELCKLKNLDCAYLTYWYSCRFTNGKYEGKESVEDVEIQHQRERLLKVGSMTWKKRIHETPAEREGYPFKHANFSYDKEKQPIVVVHTGSFRGESNEIQSKRDERNREILELELEDERKTGKPDPRTILYLMKILAEKDTIEHLNRCIVLGEEYMTLSGWDIERSVCRMLQGRALKKLGLIDDAIRCYEDAIKEYRFKPSPYIQLADLYCMKRKYKDADTLMNIVLSLKDDDDKAGISNVLEDKLISLQVLLKIYWEWDQKRDTQKAFHITQQMVELNPSEEIVAIAQKFEDIASLDSACREVDKLCQYLISIDDTEAVFRVLESLPQAIKTQPFAIELMKKHKKPRKWDDYEICYIASFGGKALEEWDGNSVKQGIGGSETAVIKLSEAFVKQGYKVFVYGDPGSVKEINGVIYLPWYYLNTKDKFSTVIQWRSANLCRRISAKKFFVDLHDVAHPNTFKELMDGIDGIMVKSQAHKNLLFGLPQEKIIVIPNGVE